MREAKIRSGMPVKLLSSLLERRRKIRYCVATCLRVSYSLIARPRIRSVENTSQINVEWMNSRPLVGKCLVQVMGFPSVECDLFIALTS